MDLGRPGLENQHIGAGRGQAIIGAVIGSQRAKFRDRIRGRSNAHASGTAAVVIFTAIEQINIVILAESVVLHSSAATYWCVGGGGIDLTRCAGRQSGKLVYASPVDREL